MTTNELLMLISDQLELLYIQNAIHYTQRAGLAAEGVGDSDLAGTAIDASDRLVSIQQADREEDRGQRRRFPLAPAAADHPKR